MTLPFAVILVTAEERLVTAVLQFLNVLTRKVITVHNLVPVIGSTTVYCISSDELHGYMFRPLSFHF
jgi:hypothetical protein